MENSDRSELEQSVVIEEDTDGDAPFERTAPPPSSDPPPPTRWHLSFFHKITLHLMLLILMSVLGVTAVTAFQYRRDMYNHKFAAASSVFKVISTLVAEQARTVQKLPTESRLDMLFSFRFKKGSFSLRELIEHAPSHIMLYSQDGQPYYQFSQTGESPNLTPFDPAVLEEDLFKHYDPALRVIIIAGRIYLDGQPLGFLEILVPTDIQEKVEALYVQILMVTALVVLFAGIISLFFTRAELAPIAALTRTAREVHEGNLDRQVKISRQDEIGELATTFNEMVASLGKRISLMNKIQESTVRIGRELDKHKLADIMLQVFSQLSTSPSCRFYRFQESSQNLEVRCEMGAENRLPLASEDRLAISAFGERWVQYKRADGAITSDPIGAMELAIPLLSGQDRVGVVRIGRSLDNRPYDDATITMLKTFAMHSSVAVQNASLYEKLREQERIKQEMNLARHIQQGMLPATMPEIPDYDIYGASIPANEVGGDYFDYVCPHENEWHFIIGDVSGKGVPAALVMSTVRSMIHTYAEFESSPRSILTKVNRSLVNDLDPDMFVTITSLRLDARQHKAYVARAGHEPVLLRRESGRVEYVNPPGAAVGLLDQDVFDSVLTETEFTLNHNELLVLYTDGITEALNRDREEFGPARLEQLIHENNQLDARQLFNAILTGVRSFSRGMPQQDDMTIVIVRHNGEHT